MSNRKRTLILLGLAALAAASLLLAIMSGSFGGTSVLSAIFSTETDPGLWMVVQELRLPRALSTLVVGAQLALAGVLMQALLRNPLADPYVLGVSGGASVGALLALMRGGSAAAVSSSAFAGALVNVLMVFGLLGRRAGWSSERLLLTGVVVASGWGALISLLLVVSENEQLKGMLFWLMGDFSHVPKPGWNVLVLVAGAAVAWSQARPLNLLLHGSLQAEALGVYVRPLRLLLFVLTSLLTASAVTQAGSVGFVGLVVPHLMRLLLGSDHRWLIPASLLCGASLLTMADTLARTLIAPEQLPVGVVTAFLGVPLFLWLLNRGGRP